jgi:hypothetical protein
VGGLLLLLLVVVVVPLMVAARVVMVMAKRRRRMTGECHTLKTIGVRHTGGEMCAGPAAASGPSCASDLYRSSMQHSSLG